MTRRGRRVPALVAASMVILMAGPRMVGAQSAGADPALRGGDERRPLRVCAGGDVTLGTNLDSSWARIAARRLRARFALLPAPDSLLAPLRPLLGDADVVLVNVEGALGSGPSPRKCSPRSTHCFAIRQPPEAAAALRRLSDSGVVVANLANNHARDAGPEGLDTTVAYLSRAGVLVTGVDTLATPVPTPSGDTIGILGFHTSAESPDARDLDAVRRHVARAVARFATVIVTMHLGAEGVAAQRTRDTTEVYLRTDRGNPVAFAATALDAAVTLVVGHGPHVLRAAEWRDDRLALYSLGNLLSYGPFRIPEPENRGAVACASIVAPGRVASAELRPTMQLAPGVLRADTTARAMALVDSLSGIDFPRTGVRVGRDGVLRRREPAESVAVVRRR